MGDLRSHGPCEQGRLHVRWRPRPTRGAAASQRLCDTPQHDGGLPDGCKHAPAAHRQAPRADAPPPPSGSGWRAPPAGMAQLPSGAGGAGARWVPHGPEGHPSWRRASRAQGRCCLVAQVPQSHGRARTGGCCSCRCGTGAAAAELPARPPAGAVGQLPPGCGWPCLPYLPSPPVPPPAQSPALAAEPAWAHSLAVPEAGGLLLATPVAHQLLGPDFWQVGSCSTHGPVATDALCYSCRCPARPGAPPK